MVGDFVELEKDRRGKEMIADRNLDLGFTAYDSIHEIRTNTKANSFQIFIKSFNNSQRSLHDYI